MNSDATRHTAGATHRNDQHAGHEAGGSATKHRGPHHRVWRAVPRLSRFAIEHLLLLPLGAVIALIWVNTRPESYYRFTYAIAFVVNDVAMAFFFALITKEVVEATAPGGVLHPWRRAVAPMIAALGATVVPALAYGP